MTMGMQIAGVLHELYPEKFHVAKILVLTRQCGNHSKQLEAKAPAEQIVSGWKSDSERLKKCAESIFVIPLTQVVAVC